MLQEAPRRPVEVHMSVMNLFDKSTFYTALLPVEGMVRMARNAGYEGLQWHPIRGFVAGVQMNAGLLTREGKRAIKSLHQSWRSEKNLRDLLHHPNRALATVSYVLLPERVASLTDLERLQKILGRSMPVILYPSYPGEPSGTNRHFREKLFQPTVDVMQRWGASDLDQLWRQALRRGFDGYCLDLFHFRKEEDGVSMGHWQETLPKLLPKSREIHVSAGRVDIAQYGIDTMEELRELLEGRGELAQILGAIKDFGWNGRIVTEIPAAALSRLRGAKNIVLPQELIEDHRRIVESIKGNIT